KPEIESGGDIRVLFPMRGKADQMPPVIRHADAFPIEICGRKRIERERKPVQKKEPERRKPLDAWLGERNQKKKNISQADLGEDIGEHPLGLLAPRRGKKDSQQNKQYRAPHGMTQHYWKRLA